MGIRAGKNDHVLPCIHNAAIQTRERRSSLPHLLPNNRHQSPTWSYSEIIENCKLLEKSKLPKLEKDPLKKTLNRDFFFKNSNQLNRISSVDNGFITVDYAYEEAGEVGQPETAMLTFNSGEQKRMFYIDLDDASCRTQNIDLCGDGNQKVTRCYESSKQIEISHKRIDSLTLPKDKLLLTKKGSKAQYESRPVVCSPAASRTAFLNRNKIQHQLTVLHRRADREDIMVSMEKRLAKSTKTKNSLRKSKSKSQKSKRPKTAESKLRIKRNLCLLTCVKPKNVEEEKLKFMRSGYKYNPQFKYEFPASENVLARHNKPSSQYVPQALTIIQKVLNKYGNYEKFERTTGGQLLTKTQLWNTVKKYLQKEGFYGDVVVNINNDIIARAAMTVTGGRPTLSIRESAAKRLWVEGLLRHEIGTHHLRFHNNRQQVWHNSKVRRQMGLKPANPTEEGLASLHSVLLRKDPSLWRSAILYYSVYRASQMSFVELFDDLGQFVESPEVRWDYCLRCKRGQYDTSKPGCFCKDQVYLTGILQLLQARHTLDFHLLCTMGKVSHEDIQKLRPHYNAENTKIPSFMQDLLTYRARLDHIVEVNGLEKWLTSTNEDTK